MDCNMKDQKEKPKFLVEVANVEKQLWALIHTKGVLHSDVQVLYRKVCCIYEKIILNDLELMELQEIEFSLWKLHYRHIDEFRKGMKRSCNNEQATKSAASQGVAPAWRNNDSHVEGFKSFLIEASKFYQNLIKKIKIYYGLLEDFSFSGRHSVSVEPKKMQKLQFLCHRFLVCLGDLARYREQCEKLDELKQDWSVAVAYYSEATKTWPHSGNPQNQLAVLATYVGDEFLALYHCVQSLAVKEPFPDAWNNLILLFERNRSSPLHSLSNEAHFDVLNPSESDFQTDVKGMGEGLRKTHLWPLFIRMISFFFIESRMEDFPCTFASTIKELDILMALDDTKLKDALESYQHMDSARTGPFRALHAVSIFIFVVDNLIISSEARDLKNKNDSQKSELTEEALIATFIFMGRLANRCLKANALDTCPLLPALLVFSEWLVGILDQAEMYGSDENSTSAMLYFFGTFLEILRRIGNDNQSKVETLGSIALWEDYELRGFAPLAGCHVSLDFSSHWAHADSYKSGAQFRVHRLISSAIKVADRANSRQKWVCHDKTGGKFYLPESNKVPSSKEAEIINSLSNVVEVKELDKHVDKMTEVKMEEKPSNSPEVSKSIAVEDEEVILFKPLMRHNSAPLYKPIMNNNQRTPEDTAEQIVPADECLRRATSMLIAQNPSQADPSAFDSDLSNFKRNKLADQQDAAANAFSEASTSSEPPALSSSSSAGPPSLNAWVLSQGLSNDKVKGKRETSKPSMPSIEEVALTSFDYLSISDTDKPTTSSRNEPMSIHNSSRANAGPVPSAPFLPNDAVWFNSIDSKLSNYSVSGNINSINNFSNPSQVNGYANWTSSHQLLDYSVNIPGFTEGSPPPTRRLTSSEWLRQYRENHNIEWSPTFVWPANTYAAVNTGNMYGNDMSRSGLFEQFGVPLTVNPVIYENSLPLHSGFPPVYGIADQRREKHYQGHQRASPYGCGAGAASEPEPLLQYLKEKEWLLQQDPTLRGPTYM